jgi:CubicO group peptidase (beta-lactamase class C family)
VVVAPPHVAPVAALESATLAMILEEEHRLDLDRPVHSYLPEFNAAHKATITPRMLLTHSGGLEAGAPLYLKYRGRAQFLEHINTRPVRATPAATTVYSDWDMVVLQDVIERIAGMPLDRLAYERVLLPLGMNDTRFVPNTHPVAHHDRAMDRTTIRDVEPLTRLGHTRRPDRARACTSRRARPSGSTRSVAYSWCC